MKTTHHSTIYSNKGFALIATIAILSLVLLVALAMVSLSTSTIKKQKYTNHQAIAKANAEFALKLALQQLQQHMGPDQRVSANAAILDSNPTTPEIDDVAHPNWLGAWETTFEANSRDWPIVGKDPDLATSAQASASPYLYKGIYNDLRESETTLNNGKWKNALRKGWLVSGSETYDHTSAIPVDSQIQLVGRGSLGDNLNSTEFDKRQVLVPAETIFDQNNNKSGRFAYWVTDNNLKAALNLNNTPANPRTLAVGTIKNDPGAVTALNGARNYDTLVLDSQSDLQKFLSYNTIVLHAGDDTTRDTLTDGLSENFHDFTVAAPGLFTDVIHGGFKKDLTPLLFGNATSGSTAGIELASPKMMKDPSRDLFGYAFNSTNPIIPGERKALLTPSFDGLRSWAQKKYDYNSFDPDSTLPTIVADLTADDSVKRPPSLGSWIRYRQINRSHAENEPIADGVTIKADKWAQSAPKYKPVMTEASWSFYFSHTEASAANYKNGGTIRTMIIPKVVLWNPYNANLVINKDLVVLMPNPAGTPLQENEAIPTADTPASSGKVTNCVFFSALDITDGYDAIDKLEDDLLADDASLIRLALGYIYANFSNLTKMGGSRVLRFPTVTHDGKPALFPNGKNLAFIIKANGGPITLKPGQSLSFTTKGGASGMVEYNIEDINKNELVANALETDPTAHHFYHDYTLDNAVGEIGGGNYWAIGKKAFKMLDLSKLGGWDLFFRSDSSALFTLKSFAGGNVPDNVAADEIANVYDGGAAELAFNATKYNFAKQFLSLQVMNTSSNLQNSGANMYDRLDNAITSVSDTDGSGTTIKVKRYNKLYAAGIVPPADELELTRSHVFGTKLMWLDESETEAKASEYLAFEGVTVNGTPRNSSSYRWRDTIHADGATFNRHAAFNPAAVANWNVRASTIMRSPMSPSYRRAGSSYFYTAYSWGSTAGAWIEQLQPLVYTDGSVYQISDGMVETSSFGIVLDLEGSSRVPLFDLPDKDFGSISLAELRHASLSPYSWAPSYLVGSSLIDLHAPYGSSAFPELEETLANQSNAGADSLVANFGTSFDLSLGSQLGSSVNRTNNRGEWGPGNYKLTHVSGETHQIARNNTIADTDSILFKSGNSADTVQRDINGQTIDIETTDQQIIYDMAFEVNQNLWDSYFFSTIPLESSNGEGFAWDPSSDALNYSRYELNPLARTNLSDLQSVLNPATIAGAPEALSEAFWNSGYFLRNKAAFNVNSTSVGAWTAFLSGARNEARKQYSSSLDKFASTDLKGTTEKYSVFSRVKSPLVGTETKSNLDPTTASTWTAGRLLDDTELETLATHLVSEVKRRGPFLSMADFVNRRLVEINAPSDVTSNSTSYDSTLAKAIDKGAKYGTLEAAIRLAQLNQNIESSSSTPSLDEKIDKTYRALGSRNNVNRWEFDPTKLPESKTWGLPSHITQADILTPLAPAMTVRGDSFTIRTYGESTDSNGKVLATAYLEVVVTRSPEYVDSSDSNIKPALHVDRVTGELLETQHPTTHSNYNADHALSETNKTYGRRFNVISRKWLNKNEI